MCNLPGIIDQSFVWWFSSGQFSIANCLFTRGYNTMNISTFQIFPGVPNRTWRALLPCMDYGRIYTKVVVHRPGRTTPRQPQRQIALCLPFGITRDFKTLHTIAKRTRRTSMPYAHAIFDMLRMENRNRNSSSLGHINIRLMWLWMNIG